MRRKLLVQAAIWFGISLCAFPIVVAIYLLVESILHPIPWLFATMMTLQLYALPFPIIAAIVIALTTLVLLAMPRLARWYVVAPLVLMFLAVTAWFLWVYTSMVSDSEFYELAWLMAPTLLLGRFVFRVTR